MLKKLFEKIFGTKPEPVVEVVSAVIVDQTNTITVPVTEPVSTIYVPEVAAPAVVEQQVKSAPKKKDTWESVDKKAPVKKPAPKQAAKSAAPKRKPKSQA